MIRAKFSLWSSMDWVIAVFIIVSIALPDFLFIALFPWIWSLVKDKKQPFLKQLKWPHFMWVMVYLLLLCSALISDDRNGAFIELEHKMSLFIFPLVFLTAKRKFSIARQVLVLCLTITAVSLYGLYNAFQCSVSGGLACFYTVQISPLHHPTYLMVYIIFSLFAVWMGYLKKWVGFKLFWILPYTLAMLAYSVQSQSLAGLLFLLLLIGAVFVAFVYHKFGLKALLIASVTSILGFFVLVNTIPQIQWQWQSGVEMLSRFNQNPDEFIATRTYPMSGNEERLTVWAASVSIMKEHTLGVGLGESDEFIDAKLREFGQHEQADKGLNAHNQYLQVGVELGFLGLLIFIGVMFALVMHAIKQQNWLLLVLVACLIFNCLFESMFQRQSGIVFFLFWASLLCFQPKLESK